MAGGIMLIRRSSAGFLRCGFARRLVDEPLDDIARLGAAVAAVGRGGSPCGSSPPQRTHASGGNEIDADHRADVLKRREQVAIGGDIGADIRRDPPALSARNLPASSSANSASMMLSRPCSSACSASLRSQIQRTGRPSLRAAQRTSRCSTYCQPFVPNDPPTSPQTTRNLLSGILKICAARRLRTR